MNYLVSFVSLGCDKNLVDSEHMLGLLNQGGFSLTGDEDKADVVVVNTCCFIEDAKKESIENILEVARYKESGNCKALIVTGCMAQRYKQEILDEIPEVDAVVGTTSYDKIVEIANGILEQKGLRTQSFDLIDREMLDEMPRILTTAGYFAYVKISEGCDKHCTYCIIPQLRGKYRSRHMDKIKKEVEQLAKDGVSEIILVAQDTTEYGSDLEDASLAKLLRELSTVEGIEWIRVLYCYPESITDELIKEIKTNPKVCKYLDIPIQHASTAVLKRMARKSSLEMLKETMAKLRREIPGIAIRTTLIVGFPGETEEDFQDTLELVKEVGYSSAFTFIYSRRNNTPADMMLNQVSEEDKHHRFNRLVAAVNERVIAQNKAEEGNILEVLVEGNSKNDAEKLTGRTRTGRLVNFTGEGINAGDIVNVKITRAQNFSLIGEVVK